MTANHTFRIFTAARLDGLPRCDGSDRKSTRIEHICERARALHPHIVKHDSVGWHRAPRTVIVHFLVAWCASFGLHHRHAVLLLYVIRTSLVWACGRTEGGGVVQQLTFSCLLIGFGSDSAVLLANETTIMRQ